MRRCSWKLGLCLLVIPACAASQSGNDDTGSLGDGDGDGDGDGTGDGDGDGDGDGTGDGDGDGDGDGETKWDVATHLDGGGGEEDLCRVQDDGDAVGPCEESAPPDSFDPEVQWAWMGPPGFEQSISTPLVANLTDDDDNDVIDLCDIPDVVVIAGPEVLSDVSPSRLYVLDGATGEPHFFADELVQWAHTPAIGDIDNDGIPEIVAVGPGTSAPLIAFEHDGGVKWFSDTNWQQAQSSAIAIADVDADGDVEIMAGGQLFDHEGTQIWDRPDAIYSATTAADLDGDGMLEIIVGNEAYRPNGDIYFSVNMGGGAVIPQVADLDADGEPELLMAAAGGIYLLESDGTPVWGPAQPSGDLNDWNRPLYIHDLDGDDAPEWGASAPNHFGVYEVDQTPLWIADIVEISGQAGGTAFDFLGAGTAQTVYADEHQLYVFDELGGELMNVPRLSGTVLEYPTVADIDNDTSAEILVVSNNLLVGGILEYTIQAVRDVDDRWVQGRRIWNQHTYHVTNVREDGTIPQNEPEHWLTLNTFRTQAQIEEGGLCEPEG